MGKKYFTAKVYDAQGAPYNELRIDDVFNTPEGLAFVVDDTPVALFAVGSWSRVEFSPYNGKEGVAAW